MVVFDKVYFVRVGATRRVELRRMVQSNHGGVTLERRGGQGGRIITILLQDDVDGLKRGESNNPLREQILPDITIDCE